MSEYKRKLYASHRLLCNLPTKRECGNRVVCVKSKKRGGGVIDQEPENFCRALLRAKKKKKKPESGRHKYLVTKITDVKYSFISPIFLECVQCSQ